MSGGGRAVRPCGHDEAIVAYATELMVLFTTVGKSMVDKGLIPPPPGMDLIPFHDRDLLVARMLTLSNTGCAACAMPMVLLNAMGCTL